MKPREIIVHQRDRILLLAIAIIGTTTAHAQIEWKPANEGFNGGRVSSFAFDSISGNIYAGSVCDLFRFDNESNRWEVEAERMPARLLATTESGAVIVCGDSAMYRIAFSGAAPKLVQSLGETRSIAISDGGTLVAFVMPGYMVRSIDDGLTWTITDSIALQPNVGRSVSAGQGGTFFGFGGGRGITRSVDDGITWDSLPGITSTTIYEVTSFGGGSVIAVGAYSNEVDSLYRSTDNGTSWTVTRLSISRRSEWVVGPGDIIHATAYSRDSGSSRLYRSIDEGRTWTDMGPIGSAITLGIAPSGDIWISQRGRVFRSSNHGSSWEDRTEGFMALHVPQITSDSSGRLFAIAGGQDYPYWELKGRYEPLAWGALYRSLDGGGSWRVLLPYIVKIYGDLDNGMLYVGRGYLKRITYSRDYGETWDSIISTDWDFSGVDDNSHGKVVMTFSPSEGQTPASEIVVSSDRGRTWSRSMWEGYWYDPTVLENGRILVGRSINNYPELVTSTDDGATWQVSFPGISARSITVNRDGEIFLAGIVWRTFVIYRSTDGGATWELRHEFLPSDPRIGYPMFTRRGDMFLKQRNLRSRDSGVTWDSSGPGEPGYWDMLSAADGTLYAHTPVVAPWILLEQAIQVRSDIYRSTNHGDSWTVHDGPVPDLGTMSMAFLPSGRMFVGTNGCGIYTTEGSVSRVAAMEHAPLSLSINAIEPNPAVEKMFVRIGLVTRQEISLVLSDLTGREIAVLERGVVEAGSSDIVFDASGLHSGSYILTLRGTGGIVSTYLVVRR
jgi:photosystem II stability/assembly factor-like uncharacterized protein